MRLARCVGYGQRRTGKGIADGMCSKDDTAFRICDCEKPSDPKLPFFESKPDKEFDAFYCGCYSCGWD